MSDPFIAEIRIFAGNFAPRSWAFCNGQLLPVSSNTALFSLIGTTYGGDGRTTTALPNLEGRAPMHPGRGPGLTSRRLGERLGSTTSTISLAELPNHSHSAHASNLGPTKPIATNNSLPTFAGLYSDDTSNLVSMATEVVGEAGGGQSHENLQPYIAINYIIALDGTYPSRS